ncbi:inhibitor of nuclear factor kappa-B kinase-interacting protein isoform X1 [Alosa sapidissima]|uniref:inhibitor of nuclear factor kappa-B kinase-interacting protein isoform X1 n=1 Tax=Alosa sapidissima TaxID=34773 RepID=UPI001C0820D6|nr:inhibitor of nuclear factor kappa-B kinase-interacting protein isoform X1 [Alosa sapidissima]XP_041935005.1 inhibitor of nuclear factor kappa-B kinase-interacting protein isoform X1 [Alosa sapidissima]
MPSNELKQRKKNTSQKQNADSSDGAKQNGEAEAKKSEATEQKCLVQKKSYLCLPESRTLLCLLSVSVCVALTCVVLQQNERFAEVEEKYNLLYGRTASYADLEQRVERVSEKLDVSKNRLEGALSSMSTATRLARDVASLRSAVAAMQASDEDDITTSSSSGGIQEINARFLNVTETWQSGIATVTTDLSTLREESRASHVRATESVNDAEQRLRALAERLEEFETSTRRNARVFERTEADDARQVQGQLDWNTARIAELDEKLARLARADREHAERLDEHVPRAQQCQEYLPAVEEAVRTILRLAKGFTVVERRVEELGLQVLGLEDSMLRGLTQTLHIRQAVDALRSGGGQGGLEEEQHLGSSAGSEIDAMLETLREMEMEMDSKSMGAIFEVVEMVNKGVGEEVVNKAVGEKVEEEEVVNKAAGEEVVEERKKEDEGAVTETIPPEEPEPKQEHNQEEEWPVPAEEMVETVETHIQDTEKDIPESLPSDFNV